IVTELHPYMTVTKASRALPWRLAMISPDDAGLLENTLVWQLAKPSVLDETSWIKPGLISWDWWSGVNLYGVDFEAGINNNTYRYFIDFASKNGIGYILIDEGWSASTSDIQHYKDDVDIEELVAYGKERGVGIFIWALWNPLEKDLEGILDTYEKWGVKGIKIDFMDRSDQEMVNFYENVAREAAKRHLMVDFHGAYKPSGLHRKYPNVLTFEGVFGNENNKWGEGHVTPAHTIMLPFIRNLAGPMDYTPGAVRNATREDYYSMGAHPMSLGTRAHEAALFVVYESPLQMLCDSPSNYESAPDYLGLLAGMPVVWDETIGIDAVIGEYLLMARRSGDKWYVAALTDWNPRDMEVRLDFLSQGKWTMETYADGANAHREATDTKSGRQTVSSGETVKFHMAPGGGWVAIFTPVE
ncbi:MAG: glycoside hydrolase family 97 catalytic domain-containing protein, partial [Muribaculaceae bacterium]|nr:glycoside hydrolase family 97 catalytic domain-containing protein [Muribaculaceae bacterium]